MWVSARVFWLFPALSLVPVALSLCRSVALSLCRSVALSLCRSALCRSVALSGVRPSVSLFRGKGGENRGDQPGPSSLTSEAKGPESKLFRRAWLDGLTDLQIWERPADQHPIMLQRCGGWAWPRWPRWLRWHHRHSCYCRIHI